MKMAIPGSIRGIVLLIIILALLPALGLLLYTAYAENRAALRATDSRAASVARNFAREHALVIENARALLEMLAELEEVKGQRGPACTELFRTLVSSSSTYADIRLCDLQGFTLAASDVSPSVFLASEKEAFQEFLERPGFMVKRLFTPASATTPVINCLYPVRENNVVSGVLIASVCLDDTSIDIARLSGEGARLLQIVDGNFQVVFSRIFAGYKLPIPEAAYLYDGERDLLASGPADSGLLASPRDPEHAVLAYERLRLSPLEHPYLGILMSVSKKEGYAEVERLLSRNIALLLLFSVFALFITWQVCRYAFLRPIDQLLDVARRLKNKELEARVQTPGMVREVAMLGNAFNRMAGALESREKGLLAARNEADAASKAKSEFLANMSHEIRTPMNAILGMAYLAKLTPLNERQKNYLGKIHTEAKNLLATINEILDFSKIEAGKLHIEDIIFDLPAMLDGVQAPTRRAAREKQVGFSVRHEPGLPQFVQGDPLHIAQILSTLLENAVAYTNAGEIHFSCQARPADGSRLDLLFLITDTGRGMTPEQLNQFFPFGEDGEDGDDALMFSGGTGLGLTIARKLIGLMDGKLTVNSRPAGGTTILVCLPVTRTYDQQRAEQSGTLRQLSRHRMLVVSAPSPERDSLVDMLEGLGIRVDVLHTTAAAFDAVREHNNAGSVHPYHVILLDQELISLENGGNAAKELRRLPDLGTAPAVVLLMTGRAALQPTGTLEADVFLYRPFDPSTLLNTLQEALIQGHFLDLERSVTDETASLALPSLRGTRILVVEDNVVNQQIMQELLEQAGAQVTLAGNGAHALERLEAERRFDLVLMDLQMPEMDGFEATRRIRAGSACSRIPVIAMTAHTMQNEWSACREAGMDDYIGKPLDVDQVFATLARWLNQKPPESGHS